ncbi:peptide deformylase [Candidatus Carsonella ruddii]|uniref:Peptide deformylase n=1 Tax=Candidatus Carsonella ruddii CE isolate Thao2000 TaxID=1202536 RepID=J7GYJ2_CARRU|nr:peptide deformylase [Candidatus Carsonella ruddii]AFP83658.1 peptide deformylase [Candidatus Carsonella ruddii CE isolate Thao2000]
MLLDIILLNNIILRKKVKKLLFLNKKILFIIKKMLNTMYNKKGIGLSAIQINLKKKIIIIDNSIKKNKPIIMINPNIINYSKYYTLSAEGCLSIKDFYISIPRPDKIVLKYINEFNEKKKKIFSCINSRCIQHEMDHLNNILIVDYLYKIINFK